MKSGLEEAIKETVRRINEVSKIQNLDKEYKIYFKDEKVRPQIDPKHKSDLKYGVHLICEVYNASQVAKDTDDKITNDGISIIFKKSYLCKNYKDYLKGGYKNYLLQLLMYDFLLLGMITVEAEEMRKKKEAKERKEDVPNMTMARD